MWVLGCFIHLLFFIVISSILVFNTANLHTHTYETNNEGEHYKPESNCTRLHFLKWYYLERSSYGLTDRNEVRLITHSHHMDFNLKVIKHTQVLRDSVLSSYVTFNATTLCLLLSGIKADTKVPPGCSFSPLLLTSICSFSAILGSKPKGRSDKMGIAL